MRVGTAGNYVELDDGHLWFSREWVRFMVDGSETITMHRPAAGEMEVSVAANTLDVNADIHVSGRVYVPGTGNIAGSGTACIGGGWLGRCSSSARFKTGIEPLASGLAEVLKMQPVSFRWKATGAPDLGFIAEQAASVLPALVTRESDGTVQGFAYQHYTAVLTRAVQEQQRQLDDAVALAHAQRLEIQRQEGELASLRREFADLSQRLATLEPLARGAVNP
jgi:hypothetical protein